MYVLLSECLVECVVETVSEPIQVCQGHSYDTLPDVRYMQ